jgi:hypothetical protein
LFRLPTGFDPGEQFRGSREQACLSAWVGPAESTAVSQVVLRDLSSPTRGWRKLVDNSPRDKGMGATWSARAVRCSNTKQRELSLPRSVPVSRGERVGQQALRNASSTNSGDLTEVFLTWFEWPGVTLTHATAGEPATVWPKLGRPAVPAARFVTGQAGPVPLPSALRRARTRRRQCVFRRIVIVGCTSIVRPESAIRRQ